MCAYSVEYSRAYGGVRGGEGESIDHMCINPILWIGLIHMRSIDYGVGAKKFRVAEHWSHS